MEFENNQNTVTQDQVVHHLQGQVEHLLNLVNNLQTQIQQPPVPPQVVPVPAVPNHLRDLGKTFQKPPEFDGKDRKACSTFISHLNLYIGGNSHLFTDDRSKVMFAASYLRGPAFSWFEPHLQGTNDELLQSYARFTEELTSNLGDPDRLRTLTRELQSLKQTASAAAYSSKFYNISSYLSWNDSALKDQYYTGLKSEVKDALAYANVDPATLKELSDLAIRLDNRLHERRMDNTRASGTRQAPLTSRGPASGASSSHTTASSGPSAMDLDGTRSKKFKPLTSQERQRRIDNRLCLYCGESGHGVAQCPNKVSPGQKPARLQATLGPDSAFEEESKNE